MPETFSGYLFCLFQKAGNLSANHMNPHPLSSSPSLQTLISSSLIGGAVLLGITSLFKDKCELVPPGGVTEGGVGLPLHYAACGVWGEQFSWLVFVFDLFFWSAVVYIVIRIVTTIINNKPNKQA